jgi:hypothetical protein
LKLNPRRRVYVEIPKPSRVALKLRQNASGFDYYILAPPLRVWYLNIDKTCIKLLVPYQQLLGLWLCHFCVSLWHPLLSVLKKTRPKYDIVIGMTLNSLVLNCKRLGLLT